MASGPHFDRRRGHYTVKWHNGTRWVNKTVWKIPGWKPGREKPKKTPPEALAAVKVYADRERAARARGPAAIDAKRTLEEFLAAYLERYELERAAGSRVQLGYVVRAFLEWSSEAKVKHVHAITPLACRRFLEWRAKQESRKTGRPITPKRLELERAMLSGAWAKAVKVGELEANPWRLVETPGWEREKKKEVKLPSWSPGEFSRLFDASPPWLRDILTLGTQTGLRISALCGIAWKQVEWSKRPGELGLIRVPPALDKGGKGYTVPLSSKVHDMLARRAASSGDPESPVLTAKGGGPLTPPNAARAIRRACRRAGLKKPISPTHHMRRTFGRWAVHGQLTGRPIPLYAVSKWFGHSSIKMTESYLDMRADESQQWMADHSPSAVVPEGNDSGGQ